MHMYVYVRNQKATAQQTFIVLWACASMYVYIAMYGYIHPDECIRIYLDICTYVYISI